MYWAGATEAFGLPFTSVPMAMKNSIPSFLAFSFISSLARSCVADFGSVIVDLSLVIVRSAYVKLPWRSQFQLRLLSSSWNLLRNRAQEYRRLHSAPVQNLPAQLNVTSREEVAPIADQ